MQGGSSVKFSSAAGVSSRVPGSSLYFLIPWKNWKIIQQKPLQWQALCVYYASPMRQVLTGYLRP